MYQALYRKWRPAAFDDVYGQPHVTKTLRNEVASGKLSHAYLFTGSRGTGKTTCAKILAKAVSCLSPIEGNPCLACEICKGIDSGAVLDVVEIDAASNNGVDNIRELREEANFTPVKAKYRVYIIDEVHMLSIGAFNALLKILEEPPDYVIFILATTEVHKLPPTILSRCQRFDFHHISPENIASRVRFVADREGISITDEAVTLIARVSDGALRDALSLLDRCSAADTSAAEITAELVGKCAGIAGKDYLFRLAGCVKDSNVQDALHVINDLHNESCSMERLCTELIGHFRNLLVAKTVKNPGDLIICSQDDLTRLRDQSAGFTAESLLHALSTLENTSVNLKRGFDQRTEIEMAMVRLGIRDQESGVKSQADILAKQVQTPMPIPAGVKEKTESFDGGRPSDENINALINETPPPQITDAPPVKAGPQIPAPPNNAENSGDSLGENSFWPETLERLKELSKPLSGVLADSFAYLDGNTVCIKSQNAALEQFLRIPSYYASLTEAIQQATGQRYTAEVHKGGTAQHGDDPFYALVKKINALK